MNATGTKKPRWFQKIGVVGGFALVALIALVSLGIGYLSEAPSKEKEKVTKFIHHYFSTWSKQDMQGYEDCFLPDASIHYIGEDNAVTTFTRKEFVAQQTKFQKNTTQPGTEVADSIDLHFDGKLANAVVFWKLSSGERRSTGYDHFTLLKSGANWRIVDLTFYGSNKKDG